MEPISDETKNPNYIYLEAAKGARIYELILDNKNFDNIEDSQIEAKELNDMDFNKFFKYIEKLNAKDDSTKNKINEFTSFVKSSIKIIINNIFPESSPIEITHNLLKLSAFYYLFKLHTAKDKILENLYVNKIDEVVDKFFLDKMYYYNILMLLDYVKDIDDIQMKNKEDKFDAYWKIILFLNEKMFFDLLDKYMNNKKLDYSQYNIPLPNFSFSSQDLGEKIKELRNILIILAKTESFKTNERFEYFYAFRNKHELLGQINYILSKQQKKPLICLDKATEDITDEAIKFSFTTLDDAQQKDECISELQQLLEDVVNKQREMIREYVGLDEKDNKLSQEHKALNQKNLKYIKDLEAKLKEIRNKYSDQNKTINEKKKY